MANQIKAIHALRPRIHMGPTVQMNELTGSVGWVETTKTDFSRARHLHQWVAARGSIMFIGGGQVGGRS